MTAPLSEKLATAARQLAAGVLAGNYAPPGSQGARALDALSTLLEAWAGEAGGLEKPFARRPTRSTIPAAVQIAAAKTQALRATLRNPTAMDRMGPLQTAACLVLALASAPVKVQFNRASPPVDFSDLATRLVPPEGVPAMQFADNVWRAADEALARILIVQAGEDADLIPEWIGQLIGADAALPRMDTEEYLRALTVAKLREIAQMHGMKPAKTWPGLLTQLAGNLPDWRPTSFGTPGPDPVEDL